MIQEYHALALMLTKIGKDLIWHIGEKSTFIFRELIFIKVDSSKIRYFSKQKRNLIWL